MWENIKNWFKIQWNKAKALFDLNRDGKLSAEDIEVIHAIADIPVKTIKNVNQQINDAVIQIENRVERIKEEVIDVVNAVKEVGNQTSDVVAAVKGMPRRGRKPGKKK